MSETAQIDCPRRAVEPRVSSRRTAPGVSRQRRHATRPSDASPIAASKRSRSRRATARARSKSPCCAASTSHVRARRVRGDHRPKRLGQEHAAAPAGHARRARRRRDPLRRRADRQPAGARPRRACATSNFGMIFQFYHLLPELTTLENVLAPLMIAHGVWSYWRRRREHVERASELLETGRPGASPEAQAARTVRRRNAARGDRPGADRPAAKCCWPTSRPATSTARRARKSCESCEP